MKKKSKSKAKIKLPARSVKNALKKRQANEAKFEPLLARGRQRGFITYGELLKEFPNIQIYL